MANNPTAPSDAADQIISHIEEIEKLILELRLDSADEHEARGGCASVFYHSNRTLTRESAKERTRENP